MTTRRPFLSLFLCLALAVNLLAPFASANPLFTEICTGHTIVLVPSKDAPDPGPCEFCPVACATALTPESWTIPRINVHAVAYPTGRGTSFAPGARPDPQARSPPSLLV